MSDLVLPVIDLAKAADSQHRLEVAKELVNAGKNTGFLYIDNVKGFDEDELFKWCTWLFYQPESVKYKLYRKIWNPDCENLYRGAFPLMDNKSSYKEAFEIGNEYKRKQEKFVGFAERNLWPDTEDADKFKTFLLGHYDLMVNVCKEMCHLLCLGRGLKEDLLDDYFFNGDALSTLRLLRYPVRDGPVPVAAMEGDTA